MCFCDIRVGIVWSIVQCSHFWVPESVLDQWLKCLCFRVTWCQFRISGGLRGTGRLEWKVFLKTVCELLSVYSSALHEQLCSCGGFYSSLGHFHIVTSAVWGAQCRVNKPWFVPIPSFAFLRTLSGFNTLHMVWSRTLFPIFKTVSSSCTWDVLSPTFSVGNRRVLCVLGSQSVRDMMDRHSSDSWVVLGCLLIRRKGWFLVVDGNKWECFSIMLNKDN